MNCITEPLTKEIWNTLTKEYGDRLFHMWVSSIYNDIQPLPLLTDIGLYDKSSNHSCYGTTLGTLEYLLNEYDDIRTLPGRVYLGSIELDSVYTLMYSSGLRLFDIPFNHNRNSENHSGTIFKMVHEEKLVDTQLIDYVVLMIPVGGLNLYFIPSMNSINKSDSPHRLLTDRFHPTQPRGYIPNGVPKSPYIPQIGNGLMDRLERNMNPLHSKVSGQFKRTWGTFKPFEKANNGPSSNTKLPENDTNDILTKIYTFKESELLDSRPIYMNEIVSEFFITEYSHTGFNFQLELGRLVENVDNFEDGIDISRNVIYNTLTFTQGNKCLPVLSSGIVGVDEISSTSKCIYFNNEYIVRIQMVDNGFMYGYPTVKVMFDLDKDRIYFVLGLVAPLKDHKLSLKEIKLPPCKETDVNIIRFHSTEVPTFTFAQGLNAPTCFIVDKFLMEDGETTSYLSHSGFISSSDKKVKESYGTLTYLTTVGKKKIKEKVEIANSSLIAQGNAWVHTEQSSSLKLDPRLIESINWLVEDLKVIGISIRITSERVYSDDKWKVNEIYDENYNIYFTKSFPVPSTKFIDIEPFFKFL